MKPEYHDREMAVLELDVNNHPGTLSHVCGLFARRAFNLDAIVCLPMNDVRYSRIWLRVREGDRLDHLEQQLRRLHDVHDVRRSVRHDVFDAIDTTLDHACDDNIATSRPTFVPGPSSGL